MSLEDGASVNPQSRRPVWRNLLERVRARRRRDGIWSSEKRAGAGRVGRKRTICFGVLVVTLVVLGILHILNFFIGLGPLLWDNDFEDFWPSWGKVGQPGEFLANYPTDFTRDVIPIPCHSHNDYWRRIPLFEAIHYGCTGVEADVWLLDEDLYVGHSVASLSRNRTFRSLYVNPLVEILDKQNAATEFSEKGSRRGVFDEEPDRTLTLLVDFKNSGPEIWPYVQDQIGALRSKNYLSYFNGTTVVPGPITVVATGNAPFDLLTANTTYRDVFFDAPLERLWEPPSPGSPNDPDDTATVAYPKYPHRRNDGGQGSSGAAALLPASAFNSTNSYYASVDFKKTIGTTLRGHLSPAQMELIRGQIRGAKMRGLKARYWGTPSWPIGLRNHVWHVLVKEGADYLNVDDLRGAARRDWREMSIRARCGVFSCWDSG